MPAPVMITCTKDTWVKATGAAGVTNATIHKINGLPVYRQTYVLKGAAAPTDDSTAAELFGLNENQESIEHPVLVDVYIKAVGVAGQVRVDA